MVGRIGRPHGVRGEVDRRGAHRRPRPAVRPRVGAAHRPGRARARSPSPARAGTAARCCCAGRSTGRRQTARRRGAAQHQLLVPVADLPADRGPGRVLRPPAGRPDRARCPTARCSARSPTVRHEAQDLLVVRRADGGERAGAVRRAIVPDGRPRRRPRRRRPARGPAGAVSAATCGSTSSRSSPSTSRRCASRCWARPPSAAWSTSACTTCGSGPTTCTAPSTTRPTAAAPAWSCGPSRGAARWTRVRPPGTRLVVPTPAGRPFTQAAGRRVAAEPGLVFACGRYEGIDQRVADWAADAGCRCPRSRSATTCWPAARSAVLVMVEAVTRLLPGVVGNARVRSSDSHADGLLEGPSYTRPASWRGHEVPAGAALRRPRGDRPLAPRASRCGAPPPAVPTCWPPCRPRR